MIQLPDPVLDGSVSLEKTLSTRRSIRSYKQGSLKLSQVSQLLWAAQGITHQSGKRTAPSAGALYPMEIYLVVGKVSGLRPAVYRYIPAPHALEKFIDGDKREEISIASAKQSFIKDAQTIMVISGVFERTSKKYRRRGNRYVYMEAGCVAENVLLQAVALDLGAVFVGAFRDCTVQCILGGLLGMNEDELPLVIIPIGKT